MKRPELLMPAGSPEVLRTAIRYGADAVYIGGEAFGLRAKAKNFTMPEIAEGIRYAHSLGRKVYITANILAHNADLADARAYFRELSAAGPDALIISDPGLFDIARREAPGTDIHISTQANNTNYGTFRFWHRLGAKRAVAARELSLGELKGIRANIPPEMEIEVFVHGAMCISYSGRCLLSSFLAGRDANRGECTHPCRWRYRLEEETRPGQYMPVAENGRGTYIFNSKDLCMIGHIPELIEAGADSFKVEGRMKTALYAAAVARTYRLAIDDCLADPELYRSRLEEYRSEIGKCTYREFTTGFFFGKPDRDSQIYDSNTYVNNYTYIGTVEHTEEDGAACWEQKNKFRRGDLLEVMKPDGRNLVMEAAEIRDKDGTPMESAPHPQQELQVKLVPRSTGGERRTEAAQAEPGDVIRMKTPDGGETSRDA